MRGVTVFSIHYEAVVVEISLKHYKSELTIFIFHHADFILHFSFKNPPKIICVFLPAVSGGGPSSISVSDETAVSLVVSWVPPNAHVLQYRVTYAALTAAEIPDSSVSVRGG